MTNITTSEVPSEVPQSDGVGPRDLVEGTIYISRGGAFDDAMWQSRFDALEREVAALEACAITRGYEAPRDGACDDAIWQSRLDALERRIAGLKAWAVKLQRPLMSVQQ
jgi:hypothetical protein